MTTAHRPTFNPAQGGLGKNEGDLAKLSRQYSSRDMPSETKLKYRQVGQGHPEEVGAKNLRREVEDREVSSSKDKERRKDAIYGSSYKKAKLDEELNAINVDADEALDELDDDDADDDDSDDEEELMRELERIRKERAAEKAARDERERAEQERIRQENILYGNPLLNQGAGDFKVKRRWDDDVVFKNCAKGIDERKKEPTFINDAIRSEFHRKFMEKYIK